MNRMCKKRPTIEGVDVSYYQGKIDWQKVEDYGVDFAIIRAAYGTKLDTRFQENWTNIASTDIIRGCYQYLVESHCGEAQADFLCDKIETAGGLRPQDLPPVLDVEEPRDGLTQLPAERLQSVRDWISVIESRLDRVPIIYTTPYHWQDSVTQEPMREPLWISHVETDCPLVPDSWPVWMLWQYSWTGWVDGIKTAVDKNIFEGSKHNLDFMCRSLTPQWIDTLKR